NLFEKYQQGLSYADFLQRYANDVQKQRWRQTFDQLALTPAQLALLKSFRRQMPVLCLAGAWCGDCINQCPNYERFAQAAPAVAVVAAVAAEIRRLRSRRPTPDRFIGSRASARTDKSAEARASPGEVGGGFPLSGGRGGRRQPQPEARPARGVVGPGQAAAVRL